LCVCCIWKMRLVHAPSWRSSDGKESLKCFVILVSVTCLASESIQPELVSSHWIYGLYTRFVLIDFCKGVDEEKTVIFTPILSTFPISLIGAFRGHWRIWYVIIIQLRRITPSRSHGRRAHEVAKDEFFAEVTPARPEIQMRVYGRESNKFTGLMKKKPICRRVQCERIGKILVEITMAKFCQCQFANA